MFGGAGTGQTGTQGTAREQRPDAEGVFADVFEEVSTAFSVDFVSKLKDNTSFFVLR